MKILCGVDIVDISRIKNLVDRRKESSLLSIFTEEEIRYCRSFKKNYPEKFAGKFAIKEAVLKLFGTGLFSGISANCIEVLNNPEGKPYLNLKGNAYEYYKESKIISLDISISHTSSVAVGFATALKE